MRRLALLLALAATPVAAQAPEDMVALEVLPGWRAGEDRHVAGLRLRLAPGWKTYWRTPGPAGLPPLLDLSLSTGLAAAEPAWPVPEVFDAAGTGGAAGRSIGYTGEVTIPLDLLLTDGPARLAGTIEIGVCHDVCVPVRLAFAADLPTAGDRHPAIVAALVDRPMTAGEANASATCALTPTARGTALAVRVAMPPLGPAETVVIESADPGLWVSEATSSRDGDALTATAEAVARDGGPASLDRAGLRITVLADGRAVDIRGCEAG